MPKTALKVAGAVFFLVALGHLSRLVLNFPLMVGSYSVPLGFNVAGFALSLGLALWMFKAQKD